MQTADRHILGPPAEGACDDGPTMGRTGRNRRAGGPSRRTFVLAALAVGTVAGCDLLREPAEPAPDELEPVLAGALDLLAAYQAATTTHATLRDLLTPLANDHQAHADRLAKQLGRPSPSASGVPATPPIPGTSAGTKRLLAALELAAQRTASAATLIAPARHAELVAAIAACRATHVAVLR